MIALSVLRLLKRFRRNDVSRSPGAVASCPKMVVVAGVATLALVGCASPGATRYYTLQEPLVSSDSGSVRPDSGTPVDPVVSGAAVPFLISLQPVVVPEQVDRLQIVITDPGSTQVYPLESSLWVAPLSREFRAALSAHLQKQLNTLDVDLMQLPQGQSVWKIMSAVQRFESVYEQQVVLEMTWTLEPLNLKTEQSRVCGARTVVRVGNGMSALVQGHQEALHRVARVMAAHIRSAGKKPADQPDVEIKACR